MGAPACPLAIPHRLNLIISLGKGVGHGRLSVPLFVLSFLKRVGEKMPWTGVSSFVVFYRHFAAYQICFVVASLLLCPFAPKKEAGPENENETNLLALLDAELEVDVAEASHDRPFLFV